MGVKEEIESIELAARRLVEGDLTARVSLPDQEKREDTAARLARWVNCLADNLRQNVSRVERRMRQLWRLNEFEKEIAGLLEVETLLRKLPQAAAEMLGAEAACLEVLGYRDLPPLTLTWPEGPEDSLQHWLKERTALVSKEGIPRRFHDGARGMAQPLEVKPADITLPQENAATESQPWRVIGALGVARADANHPFDVDDQMLLFALTGSVGLAIERIRLLTESEQSLLRSLMEGMNEGVLLVEPASGRVAVANGAARRLLDWEERVPTALSGEDATQAALLELARQVPSSPSEAELRVGERVASVRATLARGAGSETLGCVLILVDVTQAREVEKMREDLTSMIVHDLRVPLATIIGSLETLVSLGGHADAVEREMVDIGLSGARSLLGLVNTLLDISRLESGEVPLQREALKVEEAVNAALSQVGQLAREAELEIAVDIPPLLPRVRADREKIERVLVNLLGNAVKFTPSGGTITVSACEDHAHGWVLISVEDTGEGIPSDYQERIFDKFAQVAGRQAGQRMSTGLGLTFCQLAVEAHGGRIWVESPLAEGPSAKATGPKRVGMENPGSKFTFTLPIYRQG